MTTYPDDIMRVSMEAVDEHRAWLTEYGADQLLGYVAAILMAERQRCYDLAHAVCEADYDGVTGSLDEDIMDGTRLADKKQLRPTTDHSLKLFDRALHQRKMNNQFRHMRETFDILHGKQERSE